MTRTQLVQVAKSIVKNPIDVADSKCGSGKVYSGIYRDNAIDVFVHRNTVIAVIYDDVCYFVNPVDRRTAPKMRSICSEYDVDTKVYLYTEASHLIVDKEGIVDDRTAMRISNYYDYSDVIPIPFEL